MCIVMTTKTPYSDKEGEEDGGVDPEEDENSTGTTDD